MKKDVAPEISILVPVFNVAPYLSQCLEAIVAQTFSDWECIIVDDGSTDESGKICDKYENIDKRFRVLHVKNGGVALARNIGMREAKGNFITFCDSDDWLEPTALARMYDLMIPHNADIIQTGFWKEYRGYNREKNLVASTLIINQHEAINELIKDKRIKSYLWNKMFRRNIVDSEFPIGKTFEDVYVCSKWFPRIKKMVCDPTPLYHYRMRRGSILHSGSTKYRLEYLEAITFRANELSRLGLNSFNLKERDMIITKATVRNAKIIAREENNRQKRNETLREIIENISVSELPKIKDLGLKVWLRTRLLFSSPIMFSALMRFLGYMDIHRHCRDRNLYS